MPASKHHQREPKSETGPHETGGAFRLLLAANPLPMWVYDLATLAFLEVNDAAVAHYGYSRAEFLAMTISDIRPVEDRARLRASVATRRDELQQSGQWRHRRADGTLMDVEVTSHLLDWAGRPAALVVAHDMTETRHLQSELSRRVHFDEATGLANATLFTDRVTAALVRSRSGGGHVGVLVIALDNLDAVASTVGDGAGDALVSATAERLRACCSVHETLARLGGGRFAILREANDEHAILQLASAVANALAPLVAVPGHGELKSSASVGVALANGNVDDAASLMRDAASAMRHATEQYGGHFLVFNTELRRNALESFHTEQALTSAARLEQLLLYYQPVVDLSDGEIVGCEALLRWERPGFGLVSPDRFIPLAERNGLIVELGAWVIEHAIAEAAAWPTTTHHSPRVGINLSARQLRDERLVERFASACTSSGLSPSSVCVELTESAFVATDDFGAYRVLAALREMGIEVAIDDFGTGYSSLSYLKHLPFDVVKIDRGFVAGLGVDRADGLLVEAIVRVAHGLDLRVVAEGVETESQLATLRELGCDAAQGYLLARPVPGPDLPSALDRARRAVDR